MPFVTAPENPERRREMFRLMLGLTKKTARECSLEELEADCISLGFIYLSNSGLTGITHRLTEWC